MKRWLQFRWLWLLLPFVVVPIAGVVLLRHNSLNVMYPALDKLASLQLSERWSHPEMLKIRQFGAEAIPPLRRVLREKDTPTTRFLFWAKGKWPKLPKYIPYFPDARKMSERRWTACQVIQTLGPAGKPAVPELVKILAGQDPGDVNGASMALWAVGIDADVCERLDQALEKGGSGFGRCQIVSALGSVKPPSARTLQALTAAVGDPTPYVACQAAETLGQLGQATPAAISALKELQSKSADPLLLVTLSATLWELEKNPDAVLPRVFTVLDGELLKPIAPPPGGGNGGQGVELTEQVFMRSAELFRRMNLGEQERARALGILDSFCQASGRIFIRMLLLPAMMDLGFPAARCFEVCDAGLHQNEEYYRLQAAQLLTAVARKHPVDKVNLAALIHDPEVGVRVYAASVHWLKQRRAEPVVPVLVEALDRTRHQSYYYAQILPAALLALGEIGADARPADGAVEALTRDPNPAIARLATETLAKIRSH